MTKLLKYLKRSFWGILLIFALLFLQANCDLALPEYTSKIVNVGIQQGGIETLVPDVIRVSQMDKIFLFVTEDEKKEILNQYEELDKGRDDYIETYPKLKDENLYLLKKNADIDQLTKIFGKPMMFVSLFDGNTKEAIEVKKQIMESVPNVDADTDIYAVLKMLSEDAMDALLKEADKQFSSMPDTLINQAGVVFVKDEYHAIGIDTDRIQTNYVYISGLKMLGIALLSMIVTILVGYLGSKIAARLARDLRSEVFSKVVSFSNNEFKQFSTASLITRSTNDVTQIQMLLVMLFRVVFYAPVMAIGGIIKVLNTNTSMAWIIAVAVMAIFSLIIVLFAFAMPKFKKLQSLVDRLNLVMREILTGLPVIRAFSRHKHEEERFDDANKHLMKTQLFVNRLMSLMMPLMMLVMNVITIVIVWSGGHSINDGVMQVGDLMAFMQYTMQIVMSFLFISMVSIMLPRAAVSAKRISEVLETELVIQDPEISSSFDLEKKGLIEFKHVSFRYPDADYDVITDIDFTAKPGETTAFIGSTGSGKSTIINLIPRFFDVTGGKILVDGVDIREVNQHDLRSKIGFVPQKGILFSGTIESNIKYGNPDASEEEIKEALRIAQAKFVDDLEGGISHFIAQGGNNVSGGQKQRLSIARAIAVNPDIYIFDDSFSALDFKTDAALRRALKKITKDKTVLIVAQRVSTIMHADQIIVLDEGKIVGKGTHKELMETCEVYRQIALSQLSKEEADYE